MEQILTYNDLLVMIIGLVFILLITIFKEKSIDTEVKSVPQKQITNEYETECDVEQIIGDDKYDGVDEFI